MTKPLLNVLGGKHPIICTIYDIGEHDGQPFIAMEFLEGQTLRHITFANALPLNQVLDLDIEITDALGRLTHQAN
jgi:serine/threonine protein kinase